MGQIPVVDFFFPFFFITGLQHLHMRGGVHSIYSLDLDSTALTLKRWSPQLLHTRDGFTQDRWISQHLLMTDAVHRIYPGEVEFTFTHERWSTQDLFLEDGIHNIYS